MNLFGLGKKDIDPEIAKRIPPGQSLTKGFPVLHYGPTPNVDLNKWDVKIFGLVDEPVRFTWEEFMKLPQSQVTMDIHCVTRWTKLDTTWEGVLVRDLMKHVNLKPNAHFMLSHAEHGFTANLPLETFLDERNIFAHSFDGKPLSKDHGWPLRLVVAGPYFWKSSKWVRGIEIREVDKNGFWEGNGYANGADPWKEERYAENDW